MAKLNSSRVYGSLNVDNSLIVDGNIGIGAANPGEKLEVRGNLRIGGSDTSNYISFYGTNGDGAGLFNHAYIGERIYGGSEISELVFFKGNDVTSFGNPPPGPDRIRFISNVHVFNTYTSALSGTFNEVTAFSASTERLRIDQDGNVGIGTGTPSQKLDVAGHVVAERYRGKNSLVLNNYTTVNPASNVFLYSQPNDRDSWLYLDSADTGSNWGIYHRQIDSAVGGLPGNSFGFIGGGNNSLQAYINVANGDGYFKGSVYIGGSTNSGRIYADEWGVKVGNNNGHIQFGPANNNHAHIYTDRPNFYFNKDLLINGNTVIHSGTIGSQSVNFANTAGILSRKIRNRATAGFITLNAGNSATTISSLTETIVAGDVLAIEINTTNSTTATHKIIHVTMGNNSTSVPTGVNHSTGFVAGVDATEMFLYSLNLTYSGTNIYTSHVYVMDLYTATTISGVSFGRTSVNSPINLYIGSIWKVASAL
jgi:hypothetical protein